MFTYMELLAVCHWGVARALAKLNMENCEMIVLSEEQVASDPYVDPSFV
jgi:hypothetical protein